MVKIRVSMLIAPQREARACDLNTGYLLWVNIRSLHIIPHPACANSDNAIARFTTVQS
jgi:hypothetical protein